MVLIVLATAYYVFFASPTPAIITPPAGFADITSITQLSFHPTNVTNNPTFQGLKQDIAEPTAIGPTPLGRANPFIAP
jgi:hypothetical protein